MTQYTCDASEVIRLLLQGYLADANTFYYNYVQTITQPDFIVSWQRYYWASNVLLATVRIILPFRSFSSA